MMVGRYLLALLFISAGVMHFVAPGVYLKIMPPLLPQPLLLVYLSGVAEILGGAGILISRVRRAAGFALILLLFAIWPANVYMAMVPERFGSIPPWLLRTRIFLQIPLIWWVWVVAARRDGPFGRQVGEGEDSA